MATGDSADIQSRINQVLPNRWWSFVAPIRDAIVGGLSDSAAWCYSWIGYAQEQARIRSASGPWLDVIAKDFFGDVIQRVPNESDAQFQSVILYNLFAPRQTRAAIVAAIENLTGSPAKIVEPWNPYDWGGYGLGFSGYSKAIGYGSLSLPNQVFITAQNFGGGIPNVSGYHYGGSGYGSGNGAGEYADLSQVQSAVTDAEIYRIINNTKAEGITAWVEIVA